MLFLLDCGTMPGRGGTCGTEADCPFVFSVGRFVLEVAG